MARATLSIDLDAVAANWTALDRMSGPRVETAAVVKANAYGLGAARVGRRLAAEGARSFFVALAEEGAELRQAIGETPDIYVFSGLLAGDASLLKQHNLIPCLNSPAQLINFERHASGRRCALQLDTGMHRLGLQPGDMAQAQEYAARLRPELAISHLACADTPVHPQNASQLHEFSRITATLPAMRRGLAATGGILLGAPFHFDLTRPGIGLYGGLPFAGAKPAVTLSLPVIQVRDVPPGGHVGYGAAWTAERPARIATVAAGYADGLLRALGQSRDMRLLAGAQACPIAGRVSMDLIGVDVTALAQVPDRLEILNEHQTIDDLATAAGTIGYEILTGLGARYERVYKEAAQTLDAS